jgi:hypothetical protein
MPENGHDCLFMRDVAGGPRRRRPALGPPLEELLGKSEAVAASARRKKVVHCISSIPAIAGRVEGASAVAHEESSAEFASLLPDQRIDDPRRGDPRQGKREPR